MFLSLLLLWSVPAQAAFSDVETDSWYEEAVTQMAENGLLQGYPDGRFGPEDPITAAQFVVITVRCAGAELPHMGAGHWAKPEGEYAYKQGWYDWDELPPTGEGFDEPITRQLAVKILMKALLPEARGDYNRESAKIQDFSALNGRYYEPVLAAYSCGVVTGDGEGKFRPESGLSRAEACVLFCRALACRDQAPGRGRDKTEETRQEPKLQPVETAGGAVRENGWLQVMGTQLCNEAGEPLILRGMSSHGLQWYGQFANDSALSNIRARGANVFRVAMYTGEGGYLSQPDVMKEKVEAAIEAAVQNDLYVILDWHILSDGNPMAHVEEAEAFFGEMAERYADTPHVIYEICNEPNGNVSWVGEVKPYAQRVTAAIRAHSPKAVILIGSPTWSQDIHLAAADPVEGTNLMYTLHFYAGTHGKELRDRMDAALRAGLPLFASEWGTSRADGSGGVFLEEAGVWLDFLEQRGISWCNWSLCDKGETSAALLPGTDSWGTWGEEDLSESGRFVFSRF